MAIDVNTPRMIDLDQTMQKCSRPVYTSHVDDRSAWALLLLGKYSRGWCDCLGSSLCHWFANNSNSIDQSWSLSICHTIWSHGFVKNK